MKYCLSLIILLTLSLINARAENFKILQDSARTLLENRKNDQCLIVAKQAYIETKKECGEIDTNFIISLDLLASAFEASSQLDSALYYGIAELEASKKIYKSDCPNLATSISDLAHYYKINGKYNLAEPLYEDALNMCRRIYKTDQPDLAISISNLGNLYQIIGKYNLAEPLLLEALNIWRRIYKNDNANLAISINNLGDFYRVTGRYKEAEPLFLEALQMYRRLYKNSNPKLGITINNLAIFYQEIGEYNKAENLYKEAIAIYKNLQKGDNPSLAFSLSNLGTVYKAVGRYAEAEPLYKESLEMRRRIYKTDHPNIALSLNNLGALYFTTGRYTEAEPLLTEALAMNRRLYNNDRPDLATTINNLGNFYRRTGCYREAEALYNEATDMSRRIYQTDHPKLVASIDNLAEFYREIGRYNEAEPLYKESLAMSRRIFKKDNPEIALCLNHYGEFYREIGRYSKAEPLIKESEEIMSRIYNGDHPILALSLYNLSDLYKILGKYNEAELLLKKSIEMSKRMFKSDNLDIALSLNNLADLYKQIGRYDEAETIFLESSEMNKRLLTNYFSALSEYEKTNYWNAYKFQFDDFATFAVERFSSNKKIANNLYDNILFSKGLILNSTLKVNESINKSQDTSLKTKYENWKLLKRQIINVLNNQDSISESINIDSLNNLANIQEKEISQLSKIFASEFNKEEYRLSDIQNNLSDGEAAVEIIRYGLYDKKNINDKNNSINYAALIIKSKGDVDLIKFDNSAYMETDCYNNYLDAIKYSKLSLLEDSYRIYWNQIALKTKGCKKIYLSPDGVYNQINLNCLKIPKTSKFLIDQTDIQLVNSTRDIPKIITNANKIRVNSGFAALFGAPKFLLDDNDEQHLNNKENGNLADFSASPFRAIDSNAIITLPSLEFTKNEIEQIAKIFKQNNWETKTYIGLNANENEIKSLESPTILHIATHGAYFQQKDKSLLAINTCHLDNDILEQRYLENPLARSILFFAGAQNSINNQKNNKINHTKIEDGELSALEAENLKLDGAELVVLSACQTGLGEISLGEGVYGFQRAMLQAGAKSVIASLWKISDEQTAKFMTKFYRRFLNGESARDALRNAQLETKKNTATSSPFYWAPFVIMGE